MNREPFNGTDYFWMVIITIVIFAIWTAIIYGVCLIAGVVM